MTFGKVLSPQYVIWMLPPLGARRRARPSGRRAGGLVLLLTQIEFPGLYGDLIREETAALLLVALRNVALVVLFGVAMLRVWWLPEGPVDAEPPPRLAAADGEL